MRVLSLFSGVGGLDLAAEWAGMEVVAQCEIDPYCQSILRRHWPNVRLFDDIRKVTADRASEGLQGDAGKGIQGRSNGFTCGSIDLITGGFPCQPVSAAGKRRGKADDRWLWPEMLRVIREVQPAWVVGENVAGLISMGLDGCLSDLEEAGYACQAFVVPACAVNAIHRRDRVFIVAHARHHDARPPDAHEAKQGRDGTQDGLFDGSGAVADTGGARLHQRVMLRGIQEQKERDEVRQAFVVGSATREVCAVARAERGGQSGPRRDAQSGDQAAARNRQASDAVHAGSGRHWQTLCGIRDLHDGLPAGLAARLPDWCGGGWAEPARLKDSEPGRVNMLRALGNAVVPQQAYPVFKAIMEST